eukprot:CCRYP_002443-RB/>CCRYP_002443-RB protein AED:0.14 eAED:0.12 QI:0/0.90/0.83/0.91/0.27/0.16/12/5480/483
MCAAYGSFISGTSDTNLEEDFRRQKSTPDTAEAIDERLMTRCGMPSHEGSGCCARKRQSVQDQSLSIVMASPSDPPTLIQAQVVASPGHESPRGFRIKQGDEGAILIYYIEPGSAAAETELRVGCEILSINDHRVASTKKAEEMLTYYMDKKGVVDIVVSKGGRPRGTRYVLIKNETDKSIFNGGSNVIDGLKLEEKKGYTRVAEAPTTGFFSKVRLNKGDCIWTINGNIVRDLDQMRHELNQATGKILFILTYNSFRKLKTSMMSAAACELNAGGKRHLVSIGKTAKLEDTYNIHEKLGEGAFAVVKKATHKDSGEIYAIKTVNRSSLGSEVECSLKEEIAILTELNHEHIMNLHNVFVTLNEYHLVTEYLEGGELFDRIVEKSSYTESEARDVCNILFDALNYMDSKRVAHRDLKPENLLLQYKHSDSEIKIADFGFAKKAETEESLATVCGTPGYVGPEVLCKRKYGEPSVFGSELNVMT